jgi:hypothetical protein
VPRAADVVLAVRSAEDGEPALHVVEMVQRIVQRKPTWR